MTPMTFRTCCPSCNGRTLISVRLVTVTPSYVMWDCPTCGPVHLYGVAWQTRLLLVLAGAGQVWEDPLTAGDVEDFTAELEWAAADFGDCLVEALEVETSP